MPLGYGAISARFRGGAQSGSHRSVSTPCSPNPACGFPAPGSPVGPCASHTERRTRNLRRTGGLRATSSQKLHGFTRIEPVRRVARPVYALTTSGLPKMRGWPDSFAYACDASGLPALRAGILGRATPAGLRPSVIGPHLRPLSSAGIAPRLQYYGPLRHPAGPAFPSRGSGCRVHGTDSASRVATHSIFHTCRRHCPGGNRRCSRCSLPAGRRPSPRCGRVGSRIGCFEACSAFTHVSARMVAEPPKAALLPECFSPRRYLRKPPWLLPVGATATG